MKKFISKFSKDTSGAVAVDWVVLCAAVVSMASVMIVTIYNGSTQLSEEAGTYLENTNFF